jgi:hypothetical protein
MNQTIALAAAVAAALALLAAPAPAAADKVDEVLAQFDHEPKIRDVQVAAINYYNVDPETIKKLRSRTGSKALIPAITVGVTNSISSFNNDIDDIVFRARGIAIIERQTADYLGISGSASWQLDRLLFNVEELDVLSLIGIQDGIQREVTALYYVRRRLQIQLLLNPPSSLEGRISARLRLEELTGLLDAYTGGFFSREIAKGDGRRRSRLLGDPRSTVAESLAPTHGWVALPGRFRNHGQTRHRVELR